MRVSKERAAENRERIVDKAARLFREKGLSGVGVDGLAEAAGLTYGGLYSHFGSKDRLIAEAVSRAFARSEGRFGANGDASAYVSEYLSQEHRDDPGTGCAVAAVGCEIPRQSHAVRQAFTDGVRRRIARFVEMLPKRQGVPPSEDALVALATMAGAMVLARAVGDQKLSDQILATCRGRLRRLVSDGA